MWYHKAVLKKVKLFNWNFHPLEVVDRVSDPQRQVGENYADLTKLRSALFKYYRLMSHYISKKIEGGAYHV